MLFDTSSIIILVICILSIITNGVLMLVLYLDPLKKFRTSTNYLIISLTISDFLTGLTSLAYAFREKALSKILVALLWSTIFGSFVTILLLSCERVIIVMYPLKAKSVITKHRVFVAIAATWLMALTIGAILFGIPSKQVFYPMFVCYTLILLLVLVLVSLYSVIIWKMAGKARFHQQSIGHRAQSIIRQEYRLTWVLFSLVIILLVTVVPFIAVALPISGYYIFGDPRNIPESFLTFQRYYFPIELLNFVANPFIYAWRLPDYRKSLLYYFVKFPLFSRKQITRSEPRTQSMLVGETVL